MTEPVSRWRKIRSTLASAFKVEDESAWEPTERQKEIIEKLSRWVISHRLTLPAVMTLESLTPLNFIGSQAMVFFHPFVTAFLNTGDYKEFQEMLEYRQSIRYMIQVLEAREEIFLAEQKAEKEKRRAGRRKGGATPDAEEQADKE